MTVSCTDFTRCCYFDANVYTRYVRSLKQPATRKYDLSQFIHVLFYTVNTGVQGALHSNYIGPSVKCRWDEPHLEPLRKLDFRH